MSRILGLMQEYLFSDAHGDAEAVTQVLRRTWDGRLHCLGDFADYWCPTSRAVELVCHHCTTLIPGNHDLHLASQLAREINPFSAESVFAHNLDDRTKELLLIVSTFPRIVQEQGMMLQHTGTGAESTRYISNISDAQMFFQNNNLHAGTVAFAGHRHVPQLYRFSKGNVAGGWVGEGVYHLDEEESALVMLPSASTPRSRTMKGFVRFDPVEREIEFIRTGGL